jgi:hypothetical protein
MRTHLLVATLAMASALAPIPSHAGCEDQCRQYKTELDQFKQTCAQVQDATQKEVCALRIESRENQIGALCDAKDMADGATRNNTTAAGVFTAAAVTCGLACASFGFAETACQVAQMGASAWDVIGGMLLHSQESSGYSALQQVAGKGMGLFHVDNSGIFSKQASAAGDAAVKELLKKNPQATAEMQRAASEKAAQDYRQKRLGSCIAAGVMGAVASLKWVNIAKSRHSAEAACVDIGDLDSTLPGAGDGYNAPQYHAGGGTPSGSPTGADNGAIMADALQGDLSSDEIASFPNGQGIQNAINAGDKQVLGLLPNSSQIPNALAKAGMPIQDIAKRLQAGESPASLMASAFPGMSSDAAAAFKALEADAAAGKLALKGASPDVAGTAYAQKGGGSGSKSAAKDGGPGLDFGKFGLGSTRGIGISPKEIAFKGQDRKPSSFARGDIWHEGWRETIFQIVSDKINQARSRVDQLEWATPLNRALNGLPARKR